MPDGVMPVRAADELDWPALEARLRDVIELPASPMTVQQFTGGRANLTYLVSFGQEHVVVRRPPRGTLAPGSHDMAREHKVLSRLGDPYRRAPRSLYFTDDESVVGAPFIVTEYRTGAVMHFEVAPSLMEFPEVRRRISLALVDAAADLHLVDVDTVGLTELGKPDGYAARQLRGWHDRWKRVAPNDDDGAMDVIADRLLETLPSPQRVAVIHNDLKLDNCQFQPDDPDRVTSIFDWDMTTIGDPLVDLGTLMGYWPDPSDPPGHERGPSRGLDVPGMATRAEVCARYSELTGVPVDALRWYEAFALWKMAVVVMQLHDRWLKGDSTDPRMEIVADRLPMLATSARLLLD